MDLGQRVFDDRSINGDVTPSHQLWGTAYENPNAAHPSQGWNCPSLAADADIPTPTSLPSGGRSSGGTGSLLTVPPESRARSLSHAQGYRQHPYARRQRSRSTSNLAGYDYRMSMNSYSLGPDIRHNLRAVPNTPVTFVDPYMASYSFRPGELNFSPRADL